MNEVRAGFVVVDTVVEVVLGVVDVVVVVLVVVGVVLGGCEVTKTTSSSSKLIIGVVFCVSPSEVRNLALSSRLAKVTVN